MHQAISKITLTFLTLKQMKASILCYLLQWCLRKRKHATLNKHVKYFKVQD